MLQYLWFELIRLDQCRAAPIPPHCIQYNCIVFSNLQIQFKSIELIFPTISTITKLFNKNWTHHTNFIILIWPPHPSTTTMPPCTRWCYTRHNLIICRTIGSYYTLTVAVFQNILDLCAYSGESPPQNINQQSLRMIRRHSNRRLLQIRHLEDEIRSGCQDCNGATEQ